MPVTKPVGSTVTKPVPDVVVHVPPGDVSVKFVVKPVQTIGVPVIATGAGTTVTTTVASGGQPVE